MEGRQETRHGLLLHVGKLLLKRWKEGRKQTQAWAAAAGASEEWELRAATLGRSLPLKHHSPSVSTFAWSAACLKGTVGEGAEGADLGKGVH